MASVLILGGRSDIGRAIARAYATAGCDVVLAARNAATLERDAADLRLRWQVAASTVEFDVCDSDPDGFFDRLAALPDTMVMVAGLLGDQAESAARTDAARRVIDTNYAGPALYLLAAARRMQARGSGTIVGISSVAGERGRGSNFVYGSAKAGLTALLSGLRNALAKQGVRVITVKPGFVATAMTVDMNLPPRLTAQPKEVAAAVLRAQRGSADVVYVRRVWRPIMAIITHLPERVFKRLSL